MLIFYDHIARRKGIYVSWTHAHHLETLAQHLSNRSEEPKDETIAAAMTSVFINNKTGKPWAEGEAYTRPDLAATLDKLATAGDLGEDRLGFYTGEVGRSLVQDLREAGGIITEEDMAGYTAEWAEEAPSVRLDSLGGWEVHSVAHQNS